MNAGELRDRITIQSRTTSKDVAGGPVATWTTEASNICAKVQDTGGRETLRAGRTEAVGDVLVTIRYHPGLGISPKHRILFGSRTLNVSSVANPDGKRIWHELSCTEVKA